MHNCINTGRPAISHYFGSLERFIYLLRRTNTEKNVMSDLIGTGEIESNFCATMPGFDKGVY